MAFNNILATLQMRDAHGDIYQKEVETDTQVLADAITEIQAFLLVLAQITDLGVASVRYSFRDSTGAFAAQAGSNRDVGATFQGLNTVGDAVVLKIPGIKAAKVGAQRAIDLADVDIAAVLAYYATAGGSFSLSDGDTVDSWVKGTLDR
jgi:hypothetical protein